jgi:hypothetical protein
MDDSLRCQFVDMKGQRFGKWTIIGNRLSGKRHPRCLCRCDCGTERWVLEHGLLSGRSLDCGCVNKIGFQDLTGHQYGSWSVLSNCERGKNTRWLCRCVCGVERKVLRFSLVTSRSTSCGCEGHKRQQRALAKPGGFAARTSVLTAYRVSARARGLCFELSRDEFLTIVQMPCAYCGSLPSRVIAGKGPAESFVCNGIDRIDSEQGYLLSNVLPCCSICNRAKGIMDRDGFVSWVSRVYAHLSLRQDVISEAVN